MADERQNFKNMTAIKMVKEGLKKGISETVQKHWFKRLIVLFLAFSLGFGIGIYQCYKHIKGGKEAPKTTNLSVVASTPTEKPFTLTISHVNEIIRPASELITTKYAYTDANIYENYKELFNVRLPITTNKVVFTYSGSVGIGIDLSKLSLYLDNENKTITITLPELEVKYKEIDAESFEYYNVSSSIFNQFKMADSTDLISTLLEKKVQQVLNDKNIMDEARINTELVLKSFLSISDLTKDYKVTFK